MSRSRHWVQDLRVQHLRVQRLRRADGLAFAVLGSTSLAIWSVFSLLS